MLVLKVVGWVALYGLAIAFALACAIAVLQAVFGRGR